MFMREPQTEEAPLRHGRLLWTGLAFATALTVVLGLFPELLLGVVQNAATAVAPLAG
jgi:hypothetical protein